MTRLVLQVKARDSNKFIYTNSRDREINSLYLQKKLHFKPCQTCLSIKGLITSPNYLPINTHAQLPRKPLPRAWQQLYRILHENKRTESSHDTSRFRIFPSCRSCVAFCGKNRILGVAAKNQMVTNMKNTIYGFKRLLGRKFNDPFAQKELQSLPYRTTQLPDGGIGIHVSILHTQRFWRFFVEGGCFWHCRLIIIGFLILSMVICERLGFGIDRSTKFHVHSQLYYYLN